MHIKNSSVSSERPLVQMVVAVQPNGGIGKGDELLKRLSSDMRRFRALTVNTTVIMGRKTWESLPAKPLPDRNCIVVSRNIGDLQTRYPYSRYQTEFVKSIPEALELAVDLCDLDDFKKISIIGGGEIYAQTLDVTDRIIMTRFLDDSVQDPDTFFIKEEILLDRGWYISHTTPEEHVGEEKYEIRIWEKN